VLLGDIQLDPHTGEGRMVFGVPILREDGTFAGVLLGSFRTQDAELAELVGDLSPGTSGFAYLVDRRGHVIYHPDKSLIGVDFTDRPYVQSVGQGQTGGVVWDSPSGVRWFADYAPVGETGWGVVVKELWDIAVAPARVYGRAIIVAGLSTITVAIILLWLGVRHLAIPVELLVKQTEQIGEGKQNQPIGESGIREIDALGAALDQMAEQIEAYRSGLRRYAGAITRSQEEERRRIARELHDETVQNLFGIARRLELYQASTSDPQHLAHLEEIRRKVTETLEGVRQMSRDLRPRMLDDLGLVPALETLAHAALKGEGSVPRVAFEVAGAPSPAALSAEQELAVYRVAQEAMMNVRKHAQATRLQIRLAFEPQAVHLTIRDDGKGFNLPASLTNFIHQGHLGLMGMQERVWLVGGSLSVQSAPGQGTRLDLTVPIVDGRA
jgi:two-component system sensor histidine kinase UhpB